MERRAFGQVLATLGAALSAASLGGVLPSDRERVEELVKRLHAEGEPGSREFLSYGHHLSVATLAASWRIGGSTYEVLFSSMPVRQESPS